VSVKIPPLHFGKSARGKLPKHAQIFDSSGNHKADMAGHYRLLWIEVSHAQVLVRSFIYLANVVLYRRFDGLLSSMLLVFADVEVFDYITCGSGSK